MNPYAYQPAHIQQQYHYPTQYAQQQQYYYVQQQQSANQTSTAQQLANPYGAFAYQNPQPAATLGQYPFHYQTQQVQGYTQDAKVQQYSAANVRVASSAVSSNYFSTVSQSNYVQQASEAKEPQSTATEQPPLPPEQVVSSAPPPLPPEPAPSSAYSFPVSSSATVSSSSLVPASENTQPLTDAQKDYQEKFLQWQLQYAQWQAQHQNHPDKKQYQEWQKQMSQWQQQNQQLFQTQLAKQPKQEEQPQQVVAGNVHQMTTQAAVQLQQQPGIYGIKQETKVEYMYHPHAQLQPKQQQPQQMQATQLLDNPIQNQQNVVQGYGFHTPLHQKPNWLQSQKDPTKETSQNQYQPVLSQKHQQYHVQQGYSFHNQKQVNQQEQQLTPNWLQSQRDQKRPMPQNQYQSTAASQEEQNYHLQQGYGIHAQKQENLPEQQGTPSWLQSQAGQSKQSFQNQYQPTEGSKIPQQYYGQQGSDFDSQNQQQQGQEEEPKIPKWMQNQTGQNKQNSQNQYQTTATIQDRQQFQGLKELKKQGTPNWMQINQQTQNKQYQATSTTQDKGSLPSWMQSLSHRYAFTSQAEVQGSQRPNWMQSSKQTTPRNEEETDVTAAEESNQLPKWFQQGSIIGQSSLDTEAKEQKQVPKWLQGQLKKPEQPKTQDNQSPQKQIPKWLQDKPVTAGQSAEESQNQIPNWLKSQNADQQDVTTHQTTSALHSRGKNLVSKFDQDKSGLSAAVASVAPKKLNALEQLELLRQQQEQLQQLQKLESRLKHGSISSLPSATTAPAAAPRLGSSVATKPHSATTQESWSHSSAESQSTHISEKPAAAVQSKGLQSILAKVPCKFFPKCRFGSSCRFQHPVCKFGLRCQKNDCIFDHTETAEKSEDHEQEEPKYSGDDFQQDVDANAEGLLPFSSGNSQIPGIADGELPVVPAEIAEEDNTDQLLSEEAEQDNSIWQDDSFQTSQGDLAPTGGDQLQDEKPKDVDQTDADLPAEGQHPTRYQERTTEDEWKHAENQWGVREEWDRAEIHHGEHSHSVVPPHWGKDRPHGDRDWLERRDEHHKPRDERPPFTREGPTPLPREGEDDKLWDRREPRATFDRDERDFRLPILRDDREFGLPFARHERERRPSFPGDERDRWPPFPHDDRSRRDPFSRDQRDERPPFVRDEYDRRPMRWDERESRPPFPRDERDRRDIAFLRDERERPPFPSDDLERRSPFSWVERDGRPPIPRDERDNRPLFPKDDLERKAPSQDRRPEDDRDSRPPFARDEPFLRDERERRAPFLRGEREGRPSFPIEERDSRPPFPRDERGVPFSPPPRDARDRWLPGEREEGDIRDWSRENRPAGRPVSPERFSGRRGEMLRERSPFEWDERGRSEWPPWDLHRRGRSPPGREYRGRPPLPPEELDRFGRLLPLPSHGRWSDRDLFEDERGRAPPRDWDRRDWRGPPERGLAFPEDQWRRSPPPPSYWDHGPDRFPPARSKEWERSGYDRRGQEDFERRGADDRYHDERLPPARRPPPFEEYIRDRAPPFDEHPPRYDSPSFPPPHHEDARHPAEGLRVEKKAETVPVESIFDAPGRESRPDRIVVILRGLPGSGKTHVARLLKDKEVSYGAHAPRILALDDYFLVEVEKLEQDAETGKKVKKKVTEYVYEAEMEEAYTVNMFKSFTKTLEEGFFPVVIVDAVHDKVEQFEKYWSHAKQKGFEVYVAELMADAHACAKRNSHNRTFEEINKHVLRPESMDQVEGVRSENEMASTWEETPTHHLRLDVRSLLQDAVITEVEMEAADDAPAESTEQPEATKEAEEEEEHEPEIQVPKRSKWEELDPAEDKLNKLDGIRPLKRRREESPPFALSDEDDPYDEREEDMRIGKKRVRWADLEEKKDLEHRRRIGFCIGSSDGRAKEQGSPADKDEKSANFHWDYFL